jgi:hypothetical protein
MTDRITLGNLISLIIQELSSTFEQTVNPGDLYERYVNEANLPIPEELLNLKVSDIELDFPAHISLRSDSCAASKTTQLILTLPSPLETLPVGRLGRFRITIKPE